MLSITIKAGISLSNWKNASRKPEDLTEEELKKCCEDYRHEIRKCIAWLIRFAIFVLLCLCRILPYFLLKMCIRDRVIWDILNSFHLQALYCERRLFMKKRRLTRFLACFLSLALFFSTQISSMATDNTVTETILIDGIQHSFSREETDEKITTLLVGPEKTYQGVFDKDSNTLAVYMLEMCIRDSH